MCSERIFCHQLLGHLMCETGLETALHVYPGEFLSFERRLSRLLGPLARKIG